MIGYVEEATFTAWAAARGITLAGTPSVLLTTALDWVELQSYQGQRTESTQPLSWPRTGVYIDGVLQDSATVPGLVEELQMRVAADMDAGSDPLGVSGQTVQSETVFGAVSVTYASGSYQPRTSSQTSLILAKLSAAGGGTQFRVTRA